MSLKCESIPEIEELIRTNEKVIAAIRRTAEQEPKP
jgi:hypothetical protein